MAYINHIENPTRVNDIIVWEVKLFRWEMRDVLSTIIISGVWAEFDRAEQLHHLIDSALLVISKPALLWRSGDCQFSVYLSVYFWSSIIRRRIDEPIVVAGPSHIRSLKVKSLFEKWLQSNPVWLVITGSQFSQNSSSKRRNPADRCSLLSLCLPHNFEWFCLKTGSTIHC